MTTTTDYADKIDKTNEHMHKEILDRTRRIETKLTSYLEAQGYDTESDRPTWKNDVIHIPSMKCSLKDILAANPKDERVEIRHKDRFVCWLEF